jgi:hypothetical protein
MNEGMAARLAARARELGRHDDVRYVPSDVDARVAQLATLLGLDALEAVRGRGTLEELEARRDATVQFDEEVDRARRDLDPSGEAFRPPESARGGL